jgi:hypothetical protein
MFGKRKRPAQKLTLTDMSSRTRGFILDSQIQHAHEISEILGCSAISDEVAEHEEYESDKRVEKIAFLVPLLYAYAHSLSEGATEYQKANMPEEMADLSPELWKESRKMLEEFSFSILVGAVSQLIDMGLITIPKGVK